MNLDNNFWRVVFVFCMFLTFDALAVSQDMVATGQGKVREKQIFLQVREKSGNFEKMSGNFGHLTHVRELSGNFVMSCQGIVREFCHDTFLELRIFF